MIRESSSLLQFLSSTEVSETLLNWINCFPFKSCQEVKKLTDLRDTIALSEILVNIDENYFKDLKVSQNSDKNLWLVHLVQLKKLFLKLSAYVELYLNQDWSLLPVPDFKLVAKSDLVTGHLNFMVSAVLLTATHSGKNLEFERILELVIPTGLRKEIKLIQDAFMMALEPKILTNSPRRTSLTANNLTGITPKVLFPTRRRDSDDFNDIMFQEIKIGVDPKAEGYNTIKETTIEHTINENNTTDITETNTSHAIETLINNDTSGTTTVITETATYVTETATYVTETTANITDTTNTYINATLIDHASVDDRVEIDLRNEIKLMEIKLEEMEKVLKFQKEIEIRQNKNLFEIIEEVRNLKEKREYEKIERNSLMAAFDQEKQFLDDQIDSLRKENQKLIESLNENVLKQEQNQNQDQEQEQHSQDQQHCQDLENLRIEVNQSKLDNSKLVKALKKARDHILKQDSMISELKENLKESEKKKEEEIKSLKEFFEFERKEMNRILIELGGTIQRKNLQ